MGFMAEFEYPMQPMSRNIVISNLLWQTCGEELVRAIWLTCVNNKETKIGEGRYEVKCDEKRK